MKEENKNVSRRNFLTTGAAAVAASSIIAIPALAASESKSAGTMLNNAAQPALLSNDPVYTEDTQTLTNKKIPSRQNIVGSDYVNIREFTITGTNITQALNDAIDSLPNGGQILIPHGNWTSNGGHKFTDSISIEGVGFNGNPNRATQIELNSGGNSYMFKMVAPCRSCSLKNLSIKLDVSTATDSTGLLLTNLNTGEQLINFVCVENVGFYGGDYGIRVYSTYNQFECIVNRFERLCFIGCDKAFSCNSINGGYSFDTCYFQLNAGGTALDCITIGNIQVSNCLFSGSATPFATGSTILKTVGEFSNISFFSCQDEAVEYTYQNADNQFDYVPLVFRNCFLQSKLKFTANGSVIFDSCRINVTDSTGQITDEAAVGSDPGAFVRVYLKGLCNLVDNTPSPPSPAGKLVNFANPFSQVVYESKEIGLPFIADSSTPSTYNENVTRGTVNIGTGTSYIQVYNNLVNTDSLVFAQLRTYDSGGARIREVVCSVGYFIIYLTQNPAVKLSIAFKVEL